MCVSARARLLETPRLNGTTTPPVGSANASLKEKGIEIETVLSVIEFQEKKREKKREGEREGEAR